MYINFKSKYKKFFWLLIGFCLACMFTSKVKAYTQADFARLSLSTVREIALHAFDNNTTFVDDIMNNRTKTCFVESIGNTSDLRQIQCYFFNISRYNAVQNSGYAYNAQALSGVVWFSLNVQEGSLNKDTNKSYSFSSLSIYNQNQLYPMKNPWSNNYIRASFADSNFTLTGANSNFKTWTDTDSYDFFPPDYLTGYKKITLTSSDRYVMISDISSGNIYIPLQDFNDYGGRLSYYDKDIDSQPYTSYIQDYNTTSDGLFAVQSFNLDNYEGADWVMFSKYIYLEGEDNISYSIYVPDTSFDSNVVITPNNLTGGNYFDFEIRDENGDIQQQQITSFDFSEQSPLFNILNNFTFDNHGLSSIVTAPLSLIHSLSTATCTPINLPLDGFTGVENQVLTLPCMTPIYQNLFGDFFSLYQTITTGFIAYWVGIAFFNQIKQLKDPAYDKIEVIRL